MCKEGQSLEKSFQPVSGGKDANKGKVPGSCDAHEDSRKNAVLQRHMHSLIVVTSH